MWETLEIWVKYFFHFSDESFREELHEMLIPAILRPSRYKLDCLLNLHFYYIEFIPKPADRRYQMFGLFVIDALPKEAEKLDVELHLARARIVKAGIKYLGMIAFNNEEALSVFRIFPNFNTQFFMGHCFTCLWFCFPDDARTQFPRNVFEGSPGQI